MGNEMGNNNVSGVQEQEKTDLEVPNVPSEDVANNADDIRAQRQPVLVVKEEDLRKKHEDLNSVDPSGMHNPSGKEETLDQTDNIEVQADLDESLKTPKASNDRKYEEINSLSPSEIGLFHETNLDSEKNSDETSEQSIQKEVSCQGDADITQVQASHGSSTNLFGSNDTSDQETQLSALPEDENFLETTPASEKNRSGSSDHQTYKETSAERETGNTDLEAFEVPLKDSLVSNDEQTHLVPSSENGSSNETTFEVINDLSETIANQVQENMSKQRDADVTEVQDPHGSSTNPLGSNGTSNHETQLSSLPEDENFLETTPASEKNQSGTSDHQTHKQTSTERETGNADLEAFEVPLKDSLVSYDEQTHLVPSSENGSSIETTFEVINDLSETIVKKVQEHMSNQREGGAPSSNSEVELNGRHDMQMKERESEEQNLLNMGNTNEGQAEMEVGIGDGQRSTKLSLHTNFSSGTQLEDAPLTRSTESCQVESSESTDTCAVLADCTNLVENGSAFEHNEYIADTVVVFEESREEPEVDKMICRQSEFLEVGAVLEDEREEKEFHETYNNNEFETDPQEGDTKVVYGTKQVDVHGSESNSVLEENSRHLEKHAEVEKLTEVVGEVSIPAKFPVVDNYSERENAEICASSVIALAIDMVAEKARDPETKRNKNDEETEIENQIPFQSDPKEPAESSAPTYHVSLDHIQSLDTKPNPSLLGMVEYIRGSNLEPSEGNSGYVDTEVVKPSPFDVDTAFSLETFGIFTDQSQQLPPIRIPSNSDGAARDSNVECGSPESNDSFKTATEHEMFTPMVGIRKSVSFHFNESFAETVVPATQDEKSVKRFRSAPNSEDFNMHAEANEPSRKAKTEQFHQTPSLYNNVFELNRCGSEDAAIKAEVGTGNQSNETESAKAGTDYYGNEPYEDQTLKEKQVNTLEITNSQKSKVPLLSFLKEEGSRREQDRLVAKKVVEDKWNSHPNKGMDPFPPGREKHKNKSSFFSSCMCCTAAIQ